MRKHLTPLLLLWLLLAPLAQAQDQVRPWFAVARIRLPGPAGEPGVSGSGTVIWTQEGMSLVLTCAHLWMIEGREQIDPRLEGRAIQVDLYLGTSAGAMRSYRARRTRISLARDLALLEIPAGPMPYVCHVLPPDRRPGPVCISAGFDHSKLPTVAKVTHRTGEENAIRQFTREMAKPGRSGGPLIDEATGRLVGVVIGGQWSLDALRRPVQESVRGVYVSHRSVLAFLGHTQNSAPRTTPGPAPPVVLPGPVACPT